VLHRRVGERDAPLGERLDEEDPSARRVHLCPELGERRAGGETEPAVDALVHAPRRIIRGGTAGPRPFRARLRRPSPCPSDAGHEAAGFKMPFGSRLRLDALHDAARCARVTPDGNLRFPPRAAPTRASRDHRPARAISRHSLNTAATGLGLSRFTVRDERRVDDADSGRAPSIAVWSPRARATPAPAPSARRLAPARRRRSSRPSRRGTPGVRRPRAAARPLGAMAWRRGRRGTPRAASAPRTATRPAREARRIPQPAWPPP